MTGPVSESSRVKDVEDSGREMFRYYTSICLEELGKRLDNVKFRIVFWDVLPCKIIVDRRFRGTCCLHHQVHINLNSEISNCAGVNLLLLVRNTTLNVVFHSL
jgi:hypothetical protein